MSWSLDFPTLIIQNQNFNKKNISDHQTQKCSCPTTFLFFSLKKSLLTNLNLFYIGRLVCNETYRIVALLGAFASTRIQPHGS